MRSPVGRLAFAPGCWLPSNVCETHSPTENGLSSSAWNVYAASGRSLSQGSTIQRKCRLATQLEVKLYAAAGSAVKRYSHELIDSDPATKLNVCTELAGLLSTSLGVAPVDENILHNSVDEAVKSLSYRECLIFHDWQDIIGDAVLELDKDAVRRFKVIGFERFLDVLKADVPWIAVFKSMFNDVNFSEPDPNDARLKHLALVGRAVAGIILAISSTADSDLIEPAALEVARELEAVADNP